MTGMVEKVARAICTEWFERPVDDSFLFGDCTGGYAFSNMARAAIEAMRDATPEMQTLFTAARPESPCAVWNKVIDAALSAPVASMGEGQPVHADTDTSTTEHNNAR